MNNRTDATDDLVVVRPTWMDQPTWARIKNDADALFQRLTAQVIAGRCAEHSWCIANDEEHEDFHTSDIVELAGSDATGERGWWCWLTEDRDPGGSGRQLRLEGRVEHPDRADNFYASVDVADALVLLQAIASPEARMAVEALLAQMTSTG